MGSKDIIQPPRRVVPLSLNLTGRQKLWSASDSASAPPFLLQVQLLEARLNLPDPDINQIVSDFSTLLLDTTKQVVKFRRRGLPSRKQKSARKWYDASLRTLKSDIHQLSLQSRSNPTSHLLQSIRAKTKAYRSLLKFKAHQFKQLLQGKITSASGKYPKEWWSLLRDLKSNAKWKDPDQHVSLEDLTSFCTLYKKIKVIQILPSLVLITSDPHARPIPSWRTPWHSPSPLPKYLKSLKNSH